MFYTNQPIRLHSKCLCILEMIQKSNNLYEKNKGILYLYDRTKDAYSTIRLTYKRYELEKEMTKYSLVSKRLEQSYVNTIASMVERAIIRGEQLSQTIQFTSHDY